MGEVGGRPPVQGKGVNFCVEKFISRSCEGGFAEIWVMILEEETRGSRANKCVPEREGSSGGGGGLPVFPERPHRKIFPQDTLSFEALPQGDDMVEERAKEVKRLRRCHWLDTWKEFLLFFMYCHYENVG